MALPKKRQSKARGRKRRTHYKSSSVATTTALSAVKPKCPTEHVPIAGIIVAAPLYLPLR